MLGVAVLMAATLAVIRLWPATPNERARPAPASQVPAGANLVGNPGFERELLGWETRGGTILQAVSPGRDSRTAARIQADFIGSIAPAGRPRTGNPAMTTTVGGRMSEPGVAVAASVWVRAPLPPVTARLRLLETTGMGDPVGSHDFEQRLTDSTWHRLDVGYTTVRSGSQVELGVGAVDLGERQVLLVDSAEARRGP